MLIHSIILSVLISLPSGDSCAVRNLYYVIPDSQPNVTRNAMLHNIYHKDEVSYKTLKEYQEMGNFSECDYQGNQHIATIIVKFLAGVHEARSEKPLRFVNVEGITFIGYSHSDQVIIKNLDLRIITGTVVIQNITMEGSYIIMYRSSSSSVYRLLTIVNCKFLASQMILPTVELTVESSEFHNSLSTAITLYSSFAIFCGTVIFENNSELKGGAIALIGSTLTIKSKSLVVFRNNHANETGGAIYTDNVEPRINLEGYRSYCFYMLDVPFNHTESNALDNFTQVLSFESNTASLGGDHIYGAKLKSDCVSSSYCHEDNCRYSYETVGDVFKFDLDYTRSIGTSWSAVSGDPTRLCICDNIGLPQCANASMIYLEINVYPGQPFCISAVLVGGDFGTTTGTVYAHIKDSKLARLMSNEYAQLVLENTKCTNLTYSIQSNRSLEVLHLTAKKTTSDTLGNKILQDPVQLDDHIRNYTERGIIDQKLLHIPIMINVTLLPCPPGLTLQQEPPHCNCSPILTANNIQCFSNPEASILRWDGLLWIGYKGETDIMISRCPIDNCDMDEKDINLQKNPDAQCAYNHAGVLCGRCRKGYSLAIGSSHCIHCPNNNNLAFSFSLQLLDFFW